MPISWVRHGPYISLAELRTQDWVERAAVPSRHSGQALKVFRAFEWDFVGIALGYIIMDAPNYDYDDVQPIASAVHQLIEIKGPDLVPRPVGGRLLYHPFYRGCS